MTLLEASECLTREVPQMPQVPTVFVIEDDRTVVDVISAICESQGLRVESFSSAEAFIASSFKTKPGCAVIDLRLPGWSGLELQAWLVREAPIIPVILMSGYADVDSAVLGMRKGAVTLLQKPFTPEQMSDAIREAMSLVSQFLSEQVDRKHQTELLAALTRSELETVELIISGKSNKQIAAIQGLSIRGVEDRRSRLMRHFGTRSLAEFVTAVSVILKRE